MGGSTRRLVPLARAESLRLLAGAPFGRVVFSRRALPAVAPVAHVLDAGAIVIRAPGGSPVVPVPPERAETVVAYQADAIDARTRLGWSVVVVGLAHLVTDPVLVARYDALLQRWVWPDEQLVRITPDVVTGHRFAEDAVGAVDALPT